MIGRRRFRVLGGGMLAVLLVASAAPTAQAFPNDVIDNCYYSVDNMKFAFVGSWPATMKTAVRDGFLDWNGSLDYDGVPLITWTETTTPTNIDTRVSWEDLPTNILGRANCTDDTVKIDSGITSTGVAKTMGRHESGHIIAMDHTGYYDSHNGDFPSMATCLSDAEFTAAIKSQDDVGSLNFSHSVISSLIGESAFMANYGYEQGFSYWGLNGGTVSYQTSGGATGPGHIAFTPTNAVADYAYQTMTYADAPAKRLTAVTNHKTWSTLDNSTVRVELWARDINYGSTPECTLSTWPNGKNMNQRTVAGSWVRRTTATATATPTWARTDTSLWSSLGDGDQDVQVRVFADPRTNTGARTPIRLDNVRVACPVTQPEGDCL